jgi:hypothetical protein
MTRKEIVSETSNVCYIHLDTSVIDKTSEIESRCNVDFILTASSDERMGQNSEVSSCHTRFQAKLTR